MVRGGGGGGGGIGVWAGQLKLKTNIFEILVLGKFSFRA